MSKEKEKRKKVPPQNAKPGGIAVTFLCCVLGVPTCAKMLPGIAAADVMASLQAGVLLGVAYLLLRPGLKLLTLPIGCLTLGLTNFAIDVGLLYGCAYLIEGFSVESVVSAIGTALLINGISAIAGGFK
ncbi:MAG: phage holin family protein [Clostridia bacterium]|nr:phage holin family protein [Clostridia bacterium]